jgi:hypothetical protein
MFGDLRSTKALFMAHTTATIIFTGKALELGILLLVMAVADTTVEGGTMGRVVTREGTEVAARRSMARCGTPVFIAEAGLLPSTAAYASRVDSAGH